jgi:hypothetical protein
MNTKDVLLSAAQILRERGHCKRTFVDEQGRCCAVGALGEVVGVSKEEIDKALKHLRSTLGVPNVAVWNDEEARTADEVIKALEKAAEVSQ